MFYSLVSYCKVSSDISNKFIMHHNDHHTEDLEKKHKNKKKTKIWGLVQISDVSFVSDSLE